MTRTDAARAPAPPAPALLAFLAVLAVLGAGGCAGTGVEPFPEPSGMAESVDVARENPVGPIVVCYSSFPLKSESPPDGIHAAVLRAIGNAPLSAACFYWDSRSLALRWVREQMNERRKRGMPPRVILAGHGPGATEACDAARELLRDDDVEIVLLLPVDAVRAAGSTGATAYAAGNAIVNRLPGVRHSFTAYTDAPAPDGKRLWTHINYHQDNSPNFHGAAMPRAENHRIADWTGLLNHGNADDFVLPLLQADLKYAIARGLNPAPPAPVGGGRGQ